MLLLVHLLISTLIQLSHTKHHLANSGALVVTSNSEGPPSLHWVIRRHENLKKSTKSPVPFLGDRQEMWGVPKVQEGTPLSLDVLFHGNSQDKMDDFGVPRWLFRIPIGCCCVPLGLWPLDLCSKAKSPFTQRSGCSILDCDEPHLLLCIILNSIISYNHQSSGVLNTAHFATSF